MAQEARGEPGLARAPIERALLLREIAQGQLGELAQARFALARVLWATSETERERARLLARSAREGFDAVGDPRLAAEVVSWFASVADGAKL